jgi:predicted MFS family arabinose efflux permease
LARPAIAWALVALFVATGTYYALLFTLAQHFQTALGRGALASGLIMVPWVAAFGLSGQVTRRLADRSALWLSTVGYVLLTAAYAVLAGLVLTDETETAVLAVVLAIGGLGLGIGFNTQVGHLTDAVEAEHAPDISGTSTTVMQIGGAAGVAAFAGTYLSLAGRGHGDAGFATTCLAMAAAAVIAVLASRRALR